MRDLGWYFMAGGFLMYPIAGLGLGAFAASVLLPILGWSGKSRKLPWLAGLGLIGAGLLLLVLGACGFFIQVSQMEAAVAHVHPADAAAIMSAGHAESRVCLIAGIGFALLPLTGGALLLPLGKAEPTALRRALAVGLAVVVLAVGGLVIRGQVAQHAAEMAAASSIYR